VLRAKVQSQLPLNFVRKTTPKRRQSLVQTGNLERISNLAVGPAGYSFSEKQDNQQKSAEASLLTELIDRE
jgi:hypothetical protein